MNFEPYFKSPTKDRSTDHLRDLFLDNNSMAKRAGAIINSTCFYFWFTVQGNCRNIAGPDINGFPSGQLDNANLEGLEGAFDNLMEDLRKNSVRRVYNYRKSGRVEYDEFYPNKSKSRIDLIDLILAKYYGFSENETDFLLNFDIKYRMGRNQLGGNA